MPIGARSGQNGPVDESLPELRIGDRERRETDERLRVAHDDGMLTLDEYEERSGQCWAARTRSDLDALTRDLPDRPSDAPTVAVPQSATPATESLPAAEHRPGNRFARGLGAVVLVGVGLYVGSGLLGASDGASVFGDRDVQVAADQERVDVGMVFGSIDVVVPDDVRARSTGTVLFGSVDCEQACRPDPNLREVVVDANGAFGSVEVRTQTEANQDRIAKDADRHNDRDDDRDDD